VREPAHVVVHFLLRKMRKEAVVLRMNACHATTSTLQDAFGRVRVLLIGRLHCGGASR
jgi:hypothetical protein